ncbi:MAG TPA: LysM peptidoglycan-binding domain-containing protein [Acidobacteria bacterium]|nr:LysM peptidoglycan-binding domain-containing protein [Acidobacteriota bacterium]
MTFSTGLRRLASGLILAGAGLWAAGCTTSASVHVAATTVTPSAVREDSTWETVTRARTDELMTDAHNLAEKGSLEDAMGCTDQALELLLSPPPDYPTSSPEYLDLVADLMDEADTLEDRITAGQEASNAIEQTLADLLDSGLGNKPSSAVVKTPGRLPSSDFPLLLNPEVERFLEAFTNPSELRNRIEKGLERGSQYLPMIRAKLHAAHLPEDLAYLPLIESAFSPTARSRARATGMWQFIASTGRLYGLRISTLTDERRDPELSTDAAISHLADLYQQFGDWYLALAAYNSGAGNVRRAIRRGGSRDFWKIRRYLPRETRNYVPAFIAAVIVAKDPDLYGLNPPAEQQWRYDTVEVPDAVDLQFLAKGLSIPLKTLRELNPAIRRDLTPAHRTTRIRLPEGMAQPAEALLTSTPRSRWAPRMLHRVHRGDTLSTIARRYGSSVRAIRAANGLHSNMIHPGQTLVVPRYAGTAWKPSAHRHVRRSAHAATHTVRRGDTLWDIARRYGVSTSSLRAANGLSRRSLLHPGQKLVIPGRHNERAPAPRHNGATAHRSRAASTGNYTVRSGDTLWDIAQAHDISTAALRTANGLSRRSVLHPGQRLIIPSKKTAPERQASTNSTSASATYRVRRGDTLFDIARRFGISLNDLRRANGLRGSRIHPGDVLIIPSGSA